MKKLKQTKGKGLHGSQQLISRPTSKASGRHGPKGALRSRREVQASGEGPDVLRARDPPKHKRGESTLAA
jgi:hypothetical protein